MGSVDLGLLSAPASSLSMSNDAQSLEDIRSGSANDSERTKKKKEKKCTKIVRDWVLSIFNPSVKETNKKNKSLLELWIDDYFSLHYPVVGCTV
jgi:hypothetical protein